MVRVSLIVSLDSMTFLKSDEISYVAEFLDKDYLSFVVSKDWRDAWKKERCTRYITEDSSLDLLSQALDTMTGEIRSTTPSYMACKHGRLDVLKILVYAGFPIDDNTPVFASLFGHLNIIKWLINNTFCHLNSSNIAKAVSGGHLETLTFLLRNSFRRPENRLILLPASTGNTGILQCLLENGYSFHPSVYYTAVQEGKFDLAEWVSKNYQWDADVCAYASTRQSLPLLKWLREKKCPWDWKTCAMSAFQGDIEILKWARDNGCPWDSHTCFCAAEGGNLETLIWARENGCDWDVEIEGSCYVYSQHEHVRNWAFDNGCPWLKTIN